MDIAKILSRKWRVWVLCSVALLACVMIVLGIISGTLEQMLALLAAIIGLIAALVNIAKKWPRPTEDDFWKVLEHGDTNIDNIKQYLKKGINPNISRDHGRMTALILAISGGHPQTVKLLLNYGADVNRCNCDGVSPLGASILTARYHIEKILRDKKAKDTNEEGMQLMRAIEVGNIPIAVELIKS
jgi:hypothetical protein